MSGASESDRLPEARVVSAVPRSEPRRVPWLAAIYMIGPTISVIVGLFGAGAALVSVLGRADQKSLHLFAAATQDVLITLFAEWVLIAIVVMIFAAVHQRRFLRRAHVIEGMMTNGSIEVTIEGATVRLESIAPAVPEGTPVPLFCRGSRVVELSKAGAQLDASGALAWDATPRAYTLDAWWPAPVVAGMITIIVMFVMLVVAFS